MVPFRTAAIVFCTVGVALIFAAATIDHNQLLANALLSLGVAIVAVVLVEGVWFLAGGNPLREVMNKVQITTQNLSTATHAVDERIRELSDGVGRLATSIEVIDNVRRIGLTSVYDCAGNFGKKEDWLELVRSADCKMDLLGRTLFEWTRSDVELDEILRRKIIDDGVSFRWLIMSEDNKYLSLLEEDGKALSENVKPKIPAVLARLKDIRDSLPEDKRHGLKIRAFNNTPLYCSMLIIDDTYLVTPYLSSTGARNSPMYALSGVESPWSKLFDREFDSIWNDAIDV